MVTIYGIRNCATMKKAFDWCTTHNVEFVFHDYKKLGIEQEQLLQWCQNLGWKSLLNTRGTTWRKLTPTQQSLTAQNQAVRLMLEYPSLIKRPVVDTGTQLLVGFDPQLFASFVK
ncbi:MAG: ArsC family reductase [Betaproteobacteria bacterium]|nr:ArsC family reductase [Betaproteobacteria bacterium]